MKKFIVLLLSFMLIVMCLTACGEKEEISSNDEKEKVELTLDKEATPEPTEAPTEVPTPEPTEAPSPTPEPTATPTPEPTEAPVAEHTYKVELVEVGDRKVMAIKLYRDFTGAGLAEAKDVIDNVPCVLMETNDEEAANTCIEAFEGIGGVVKVYVDGEEVVDEEEPTEVPEVNDSEAVLGQLNYSIYLEDVGSEKVKVIKVIRDELGYGLKEAKDLVDAAPVIIYIVDDLDVANSICSKLAEVGSKATVGQYENAAVGEKPLEGSESTMSPEESEENTEPVETESPAEPEPTEVPKTEFVLDYETSFEMPIEDVFTITGKGLVATGRVEKGNVKTGDEAIVILEDGTEVPVTIGNIESFRMVYEEASEGDNVGIYIIGIEKDVAKNAKKLIIKA